MNQDQRATGRKSTNSAAGFSLIELMVALALGLLVVAAMIQLFAGNKATYSANEALARVQENGRFAMELLKRETRAVNFYGTCAAQIPIRNHLNDCGNAFTAIFDDIRSVVGWEFLGTGLGDAYNALATEADLVPSAGDLDDWQVAYDGGPFDLPAFLDARVVPGSDVLMLRSIEPIPVTTVAPPHAQADADIDLTQASALDDNELTFVTNCTTGADLFQNTAASNAATLTAAATGCAAPRPGNRGLNWSAAYGDTLQVFRVRSQALYIGYNAVSEEPGLWRAVISPTAGEAIRYEELVAGVETLQVLYGYSLPADQGGDGQTVDFWVTADEVPDWDFVIGLRLAMTLRSSENMGAGALRQTFDLVATQFEHPQDGRLRQPFTTSISLRNQQLVL